MSVVAGFTLEAGVWKSVVTAYSDMEVYDFYWEFRREPTLGMRGRQMNSSRSYMMDFSLFPVDYFCYVDNLWVHGYLNQLVNASKGFRKGDKVRVEVRDKEFWVGNFKVGDVVDLETLHKEYEVLPEPKPRRDFALGFVVADFRRIVKKAETERVAGRWGKEAAYSYVGFKVHEREATILFFNEEVTPSRMDLRGYEAWCYSIEGEGESTYSLDLFSRLLYLGFANTMDLAFENKGILTAHYRGDEIDVRYWLAAFDVFNRFDELLAKPAPKRVQLWIMKDEDVRILEKMVKSINDVSRTDELSVAMLEELYLYWVLEKVDKGYMKTSRSSFWEYKPAPGRFSGIFSISHLGRWLADVEELTCFVEGEPPEALVLLGKGAKISPKEYKSSMLKMEVEVPIVRGTPIFSGYMAMLENVIADAEDAGDEFLVFVSTPFEIVAFGRDAVYYRASLPVDSMKHIEENYIPIPDTNFKGLRDFFSRFPATVTLGREERFNIYLELDLEYRWQLRAVIGQSEEEVKRAVAAYNEEFKKPPPPPLEYVKIRFLTDIPQIVGADLKVYGPFRTGMVMDLPKPNAEIMVKQGAAAYEEIPAPPPPEVKLSKEEVFVLYDEELAKWVAQQIELRTPGFRGKLYYDVGKEWEEPVIAEFKPEKVMDTFRDEIASDRETVYKTYEMAFGKTPEYGRTYLGRLSERQHHFAADLVERYETRLFLEAKEKAKAPPPPPKPPEEEAIERAKRECLRGAFGAFYTCIWEYRKKCPQWIQTLCEEEAKKPPAPPPKTDEEIVVEQIVENCKYWASNICKTETMLKYAREKGVKNPEEILKDLERRGIVYTPKPGYVGLTEPEKYGLPPIEVKAPPPAPPAPPPKPEIQVIAEEAIKALEEL